MTSPDGRVRRRAAGASGVLVGVLIAACGGSGSATRSEGGAPVTEPATRQVTLRTTDGLRLGATRYAPAAPDRGVTVLVANGNGGPRELRAPLAEALAARGLSVLLFDYRGYGGNDGRPSEPGLAADVRAARDHLLEDGVPAERLLYYGESLGTAVVSGLAIEHPPPAMLLRSPFTAYAAIGAEHYFPDRPVPIAAGDRFDTLAHVRRTRAPVTVVLGTGDGVVPPEQSRAVAQAANCLVRTVTVPGAGHNDRVLLDGPQLVDAVVELADLATGAAESDRACRPPDPD